MIIEIGVGVAFAIGLFVLQIRMSRRVNEMTEAIHSFIQQRAEVKQRYKSSQCQRIIEILKDIEDRENSVKEILTKYQIGDPTNELLNFFMEATVRPFKYNIGRMNNAIGQLQGRLNDPSLGEEFSDYLVFFDNLPKRILIDKIPQQARQDQQLKGLISQIDKQTEKIQIFIDRFTQEMASSLAEKREEDQSVAREILNHRKYFNAPKV